MANKAHVAMLKKGRQAWNAWRRANPDLVPDLEGFDAPYSRLQGYNFRGANLREAKLAGSRLMRASFYGADLTDIEL
jgi:uncharacterized protein YjbI with pentapeptide repeats